MLDADTIRIPLPVVMPGDFARNIQSYVDNGFIVALHRGGDVVATGLPSVEGGQAAHWELNSGFGFRDAAGLLMFLTASPGGTDFRKVLRSQLRLRQVSQRLRPPPAMASA